MSISNDNKTSHVVIFLASRGHLIRRSRQNDNRNKVNTYIYDSKQIYIFIIRIITINGCYLKCSLFELYTYHPKFNHPSDDEAIYCLKNR